MIILSKVLRDVCDGHLCCPVIRVTWADVRRLHLWAFRAQQGEKSGLLETLVSPGPPA